jgi:hypothetical protein
MWEKSGLDLSAREFDLLKQGEAYLAPLGGNYKQPLKTHVAKNGETQGDKGLTKYNFDSIKEEQGKLIIRSTLNWWVLEKYIHTDVVKRELEHVNRWLYWHYKGAGAEMVNDFNNHPGGMTSLRTNAWNAHFQESEYQRREIHKGGRHVLGVRPAKDMKPDDLMNLIFNIGPREFPHVLNDNGLE